MNLIRLMYLMCFAFLFHRLCSDRRPCRRVLAETAALPSSAYTPACDVCFTGRLFGMQTICLYIPSTLFRSLAVARCRRNRSVSVICICSNVMPFISAIISAACFVCFVGRLFDMPPMLFTLRRSHCSSLSRLCCCSSLWRWASMVARIGGHIGVGDADCCCIRCGN